MFLMGSIKHVADGRGHSNDLACTTYTPSSTAFLAGTSTARQHWVDDCFAFMTQQLLSAQWVPFLQSKLATAGMYLSYDWQYLNSYVGCGPVLASLQTRQALIRATLHMVNRSVATLLPGTLVVQLYPGMHAAPWLLFCGPYGWHQPASQTHTAITGIHVSLMECISLKYLLRLSHN
jgi:hypothetical protein